MSNTDEAIELLERAEKEHNEDCLLCAMKDAAIDKVLALLKEKPEPSEFTKEEFLRIYDDPACNYKALAKRTISEIDRLTAELKTFKEKPELIEFRKKVELWSNLVIVNKAFNRKSIEDMGEFLNEACDIIDRLQAEIKAKDEKIMQLGRDNNNLDEALIDLIVSLIKGGYITKEQCEQALKF